MSKCNIKYYISSLFLGLSLSSSILAMLEPTNSQKHNSANRAPAAYNWQEVYTKQFYSAELADGRSAYQILGVAFDSYESEIRQAGIDRMKELNSIVSDEEAIREAHRIKNAVSVLTDPEHSKRYRVWTLGTDANYRPLPGDRDALSSGSYTFRKINSAELEKIFFDTADEIEEMVTSYVNDHGVRNLRTLLEPALQIIEVNLGLRYGDETRDVYFGHLELFFINFALYGSSYYSDDSVVVLGGAILSLLGNDTLSFYTAQNMKSRLENYLREKDLDSSAADEDAYQKIWNMVNSGPIHQSNSNRQSYSQPNSGGGYKVTERYVKGPAVIVTPQVTVITRPLSCSQVIILPPSPRKK